MKRSKSYSRLIILVLLLFAFAALGRYSVKNTVTAQASTNCVMSLDGATGGTATAIPLSPALHTLSLSVPAVMASQVQSVEFNLDGNTKKLGKAKQDTAGNWSMPWYVQVTPLAGQHYVTATVIGAACNASPIMVMITTAGGMPLGVFTNPGGFSGQTNESINFILSSIIGGTVTGPNVSAYTLFEKLPQTLGSVSPQDTGNEFRFSAGPAAGNGTINVIAHYGGVDRAIAIPVSILPQTSTTTSSSGTTSTQTTTTTSPTGTTSSPAPINAAASIESVPEVKSCVTGKLSPERYAAISAGAARPTAEEFAAINDCFADRNHVLPSGFVPVAPDKVKERPISKDIEITGAANGTVKDNKTDKKVIKFAGKGKPGSVVLIYVFSEPLVLSAKTDKNGDWGYSLEDPLQPGNHEAYAMVAQGDGNYSRSSVFSFAIAKAEASPVNPNGYSLQVQSVQATANENNRSINMYIIGVGLLILAVLGIMGYILSRKHKPVAAAVNTVPGEVHQEVMAVATEQPPIAETVPLAEQAPQPNTVFAPETSAVQQAVASPEAAVIEPQEPALQENLSTPPLEETGIEQNK